MTIKDHQEAVTYFKKLVADLILCELGKQPLAPITMERLEEAAEHIKDISQCQRPAVVRRGQGREWHRPSGLAAEYEVDDER
ncbi:MAG: hypothetical protein AMS14_07175 [Planctomycetes bacterium DG_20]|nr:MAG: hypothetical protein AMS14_07175 [Planctomycetes bacterium DG_20]